MLRREVTFTFEQTPLAEAIAYFAEMNRLTVILDPGAARALGRVGITLRVSRMPLERALERAFGTVSLTYALIDHAVFVGGAAEVRRMAELADAQARDLGRAASPGGTGLKDAMARGVSFEFFETPLGEAVAFMQQLARFAAVLDVEPDRREAPVSLRVTDLPLESALLWLARLTGLACSFGDGCVLIATPELPGLLPQPAGPSRAAPQGRPPAAETDALPRRKASAGR